jgi:hypothetical protein
VNHPDISSVDDLLEKSDAVRVLSAMDCNKRGDLELDLPVILPMLQIGALESCDDNRDRALDRLFSTSRVVLSLSLSSIFFSLFSPSLFSLLSLALSLHLSPRSLSARCLLSVCYLSDHTQVRVRDEREMDRETIPLFLFSLMQYQAIMEYGFARDDVVTLCFLCHVLLRG